MSIFFIIELLLVLVLSALFWRRATWVWGIGLLTAATAVFYDVVLAIFGREELLISLGAFSHLLHGLMIGGAALWLWGILHPTLTQRMTAETTTALPLTPEQQARHDQLLANFSADDLFDLMFDMGMGELEVVAPAPTLTQTAANIIRLADERQQTDDLALAIERILTPIPPEHLPRVDHLQETLPPAILRYYLLSFYFLDQLQLLSEELGLDWERLGLGSKQQKVRQLLLHLRREGRLGNLIALLKSVHNKKV